MYTHVPVCEIMHCTCSSHPNVRFTIVLMTVWREGKYMHVLHWIISYSVFVIWLFYYCGFVCCFVVSKAAPGASINVVQVKFEHAEGEILL